MVPGVPERPRREPVRQPGRPLEAGGRQVIAHQPQVQIREIAQPRIQVGLGLLLRVGCGIDGPVVLAQRRSRPPLGHDHIGSGPLAQAPFRARRHQPVGHHREHGVLQSVGPAPRAEPGEPPVQSQPPPHRGHRGHRSQSRGPLSGQRADVDPLAAQVRLQSGHDALQLPSLPQSGHLAEADQRLVPDPGPIANGLDQRQVLIHLVAPATSGRLHEHTSIIPSHQHAVNHMSPLHIPTETPPHNTKHLVNVRCV